MSNSSDQQTSPAEQKPSRRHVHPRIPGLLSLLGPYAPFTIAVAFAALAVLAAIADHSLLVLDKPISRDVRNIHLAWFDSLMHAWSYLGSRYVLAPLTIVLAILAWRRCRWFAIAFLLALPGAFVVEIVFKAIVTRPRPVAQGFGSSFPSGDAIAATVFWGLLPPLIYLVTGKRRLWLASIPLVILVLIGVGLDRIYFGAHWPSDVVGGYLGGAMFIFAAEGVLRHGAPMRKPKPTGRATDAAPARREPRHTGEAFVMPDQSGETVTPTLRVPGPARFNEAGGSTDPEHSSTSSPSSRQEDQPMSSQLTPEEVVRQFFDCYTEGRPEGFDEVVADDYLDWGHDPPGRGPNGARDDYENAVKVAGGVIRYTIDALVVDGDMVAADWTGQLNGVPMGKGLSLYRAGGGLLRSTRHTVSNDMPSETEPAA